MRKERLFYLDFVRSCAVFLILLTHFNAHYLFFYMRPEMPERAILTLNPFHVYVGDLGVSLFFIISGAALIYVYREECKLKEFYTKRFFSLYPMFWAAYFIAFLYFFYKLKHMVHMDIPKANFLLTILGMDGYLSELVPSYYLLGEWFLGYIILMYLCFPLLRKLVLAYPKITVAAVAALYVPFAFFKLSPGFPASKILLVRFPEILFGMLFVLKIKTVPLGAALCSLAVLIANGALRPRIAANFQVTYVGICFFLLLVYCSKWIDRPMVRAVCHTIGKYSYAIFLTHHVIIDELALHFPMADLNRSERYLLFLLYLCVTGVAAWLLYHLHARVVNWVRRARKSA